MDTEDRLDRLERCVDLLITRSLHGVDPTETKELLPGRQQVAVELKRLQSALRSSGEDAQLDP